MSVPAPSFAQLLKDPRLLLAFGFGSGLAKKAPGTFGTLAAVPAFLLLQQLPLTYYLLVLVATFWLGVHLCTYASNFLKVHDHGGIVWDEFVGLWLSLLLLPQGWAWIAAGFVLFRIFDIAKPWPIGWLDRRVEGGFGIMIDDVLAGVYTFVLLQAAAYFLSASGA